MDDRAPHPYSSLTPDLVLDALDAVGLRGDGRLIALGSYENRVYQAMLDEGPPVVAGASGAGGAKSARNRAQVPGPAATQLQWAA